MGQIIGGAAKPKRCNQNKLSQLGTPAAGEHILVSSDNSMNAAGQGNFDCYIEGNGTTAATELELKLIADAQFDSNSRNAVSNQAFFREVEDGVNLSNYTTEKAMPGGNNRWVVNNNSYTGKFIPVTAGDKYRLVASENGSTYCCLNSIDNHTTNGANVDYATGYTGNGKSVAANETENFTIPSGATYLYIYCSSNKTPSSLAKISKEFKLLSMEDVSQSVNENDENPVSGNAVYTSLWDLKKAVVDIDLTTIATSSMCINSSINKYVTWNSYSVKFVPCADYLYAVIKANANYDISIRFVTEIGVVGNNVAYAQNGVALATIAAGQEVTIPIPSDATYIYIPNTNESGTVLRPDSVSLQKEGEFLQKTDIVDGLQSTSATKVLSANQGRALVDFSGLVSEPINYTLLFGLEKGIVNTNILKWATGNSYRSAFIKVQEGDIFIIKANSSASTSYAFTPKNSYTQGEDMNLVDGQIHNISANVVETITIPAGTSYLWVTHGVNGVSAAQYICKKSTKYKERDYIYIAAHDASEWEKAAADIVCSGVNDEVVLNEVLYRLTYRGGGNIVLSSGTFFIDDFPVTDSNGDKVALYMQLQTSTGYYTMIKIYGKWLSATTNPDGYSCGTAIKVSTACYNSLDSNQQYKLFSACPTTGFAHNYLELHDIRFTIPWNQKKIMMLDLLYIYGANLYDCRFMGYDNATRPSDKWDVGVSTRPEAGVEGCIGIRLFRDSNAGSINYFRQVGAAGFHTGWQLGADHSVLMQCFAIQNVYGFTVGEYDALGGYDTNHPITLIGFTYERNCNYPVFYGNGYGGHEDSQMVVNIYSMNIEPGRGNGGTPLPPDSEYHLMTETVPGNCRGIITYYMWQNRDGTAHLWGDGHGHGFHTTNIAHKKGGTTTLRTSYAPTYMQHYFDTDLNKEVICINPHAKTWVDAMGNQV